MNHLFAIRNKSDGSFYGGTYRYGIYWVKDAKEHHYAVIKYGIGDEFINSNEESDRRLKELARLGFDVELVSIEEWYQ